MMDYTQPIPHFSPPSQAPPSGFLQPPGPIIMERVPCMLNLVLLPAFASVPQGLSGPCSTAASSCALYSSSTLLTPHADKRAQSNPSICHPSSQPAPQLQQAGCGQVASRPNCQCIKGMVAFPAKPCPSSLFNLSCLA
jgi:hypothetical protein